MGKNFFKFSLGVILSSPALCVDFPAEDSKKAPLTAEDYEAVSLGTLYARQEFVVRTDPDPEAPARALVPRGHSMSIISESEDKKWYWVALDGGIQAWAWKEFLSSLKPEEPKGTETLIPDEELKKFHHVLGIDKFYTFNLMLMAGPSGISVDDNPDPRTYSTIVFGPGIGQRLGNFHQSHKFLAEAQLLIAAENHLVTGNINSGNSSFVSLGAGANIRYLWTHAKDLGGGVFGSVGLLLPIEKDNEESDSPGPLFLRGGVSVSIPAFENNGALIFDLGVVYRPRAFGALGEISVLF